MDVEEKKELKREGVFYKTHRSDRSHSFLSSCEELKNYVTYLTYVSKNKHSAVLKSNITP